MGKVKNKNKKEFYKKVKSASSYDDAKEIRRYKMELKTFDEFRAEIIKRLKEKESNWKSQAKTFDFYIKDHDAEDYIKSGYKRYIDEDEIKQSSHMTPENYFNATIAPIIMNIEWS